MAAGYLALDLLHLEHRVRRLERAAERREWRETRDPFELQDDVFIDKFRLSPDVALELVEELTPFLQRQRSYGISVERQVLTALRFYATGCYQDSVGDASDLCLSQPSVSRCVRRVTNCINERLLRPWVRFPMTAEERHTAREKFRNAPQPFEGAIGAMDCSYVQILAPQQHAEAYVNHWGDHCLNVQAICDPDLKILNINARYPGARDDYYIWTYSPVKTVMERNYNNGERNTWLIGDDGYFVEPWLMTPLKHEQPDTPRFRYNDALCSAGSIIERLFGVWKAEFRCLSSQRKLMYEPTMASKIVNACAVLHNMRIANNIVDMPPDPVEVQAHLRANAPDIQIENDEIGQPQRERSLAKRVQDSLITRHFTR